MDKVVSRSPMNVQHIPLQEWPRLATRGQGEYAPCPPIVFTTQRGVSPEGVAEKDRQIAAGDEPSVSLIRGADGRVYLFDGHHTLAAYTRRGVPPRCFWYVASRGGDLLAPPRLRRRRGASGRPIEWGLFR